MKSGGNKVKSAYAAAFVKQVIYGLSIFFTTSMLQTSSVFDVLSIRFLITFLTLTLLRVCGVLKVNLKGKSWKPLLLTFLFEPTIYFMLESFGLSRTSTLLAGIILAMAPIFTILLEMVLLKEKNSLLQNVLIVTGMCGGICITVCSSSESGGTSSLIGILLIVGAMLVGCMYSVNCRRSTRTFTPTELLYCYAMTGAAVFNAINVVRRLAAGTLTHYFAPLLDPKNLLGFLYLAVLSSVVATFLGMYSVSHVQASSLSPMNGVNTIVSILAGVFIAGDTLYWYHAVGAVLILIGAIGTGFIKIRNENLRLKQERSMLPHGE